MKKNSAVSDKGHVLAGYGFYLVVLLGQYADQELLKPLSNKISDLSLKYILIQVHDQQGQQ